MCMVKRENLQKKKKGHLLNHTKLSQCSIVGQKWYDCDAKSEYANEFRKMDRYP